MEQMWLSYTTIACVKPIRLDDPLFRSVDRKIAGNQKVLGSREKQLRPTLGKGHPRVGVLSPRLAFILQADKWSRYP